MSGGERHVQNDTTRAGGRTAAAPSDSARRATIEAVRGNGATALQVMDIHRCLQRWAELGKGTPRDEARRALTQVESDEPAVRWYETVGGGGEQSNK